MCLFPFRLPPPPPPPPHHHHHHRDQDLDGNPINVHTQQDVNEFFNSLCDKLQEALKKTSRNGLMEYFFGGTLEHQIVFSRVKEWKDDDNNQGFFPFFSFKSLYSFSLVFSSSSLLFLVFLALSCILFCDPVFGFPLGLHHLTHPPLPRSSLSRSLSVFLCVFLSLLSCLPPPKMPA